MHEDFAEQAQARTDLALNRMMPVVQDLAREAGSILMKYYGKNYNIEIKDDDSPVTIADKESSRFLVRELERLTPFPVVSEENDYDPAADGVSSYWAVDPLDGTKEFIDQTGGFCIKIALIHNTRPTLSVVYCPVQKILYDTIENSVSNKTSRSGTVKIITAAPVGERGRLRTLFNQKHADPAEYQRYRAQMTGLGVILPARPAIKPGLPRNLRVAEGRSDLHVGVGYTSGPMKGSGFIWDSAPDHLILTNAGGGMVNLCDGADPVYDAARERMPAYLAYGDPVLREKMFPKFRK